ncbi:MAG: hypothetical protein GKR95_10560 [Gammaproteobacteria bacterium]|nr:hypothetical protein [Gammaproteobacteria bacterium]
MPLGIKRLIDEPIIHRGLSDHIGSNINGASLIRVPDWLEEPLGRYYLYFAHHEGRYIRMAYGDSLTGPWRVYEPGVLDVEHSGFVAEDLTAAPGIRSKEEAENETESEAWLAPDNGDFLYAHIASPDVHVDHSQRVIRMYYHGMLDDGRQKTRLALSSNGIDFRAEEPILGICYFRVFHYGNYFYAIGWGGKLLRAKSWSGPFEQGPDIFEGVPVTPEGMVIRHVATRLRGDQLDLFYSCIGDYPETIRRTIVNLHEDWTKWQVQQPEIVLTPEKPWEGGDLPMERSSIGAAEGPVHGLRDPCVFEEDGKTYLLYCGAGESCIGIAEMRYE